MPRKLVSMAPIYSRGRGAQMAAKARQVGKAILGAKLRHTNITVVRSTPT